MIKVRYCIVCMAVIISAAAALGNSDTRGWTLITGETFRAELVKYDMEKDEAVLRMREDDPPVIYSLEDFSAIDGAWLIEWAKASKQFEEMIGDMEGEFRHFHHEGQYTSDIYAYTPSKYREKKDLPLLFLFHPGGKGARYIQRFMKAAEELDLIILSSDSFRNTTDPEVDRIQNETFKEILPVIDEKLSYDKTNLYLGGTSGGAMLAFSLSALITDRNWAGIYSNGGWLGGPEYYDVAYPAGMRVAMVNGHRDSAANRWIKPDAELLESKGSIVNVFAFEGGHQVPPTDIQIESLQWMLKGDESISNTPPLSPVTPVAALTTAPRRLCKITITNPSKKTHSLTFAKSDGTVIANEYVPALGNEPPAIWKTIEADIAGQDVVITVDGHTKTVSVAKDTAEFVLDIAAPGHVVSQHTKQLQWK